MAQARCIVYNAVEQFGGTCPMEEINALCSGLTEMEVFLTIDEMSRSGEIRLLRDTGGTYFIRTCQVAPRHNRSLPRSH